MKASHKVTWALGILFLMVWAFWGVAGLETTVYDDDRYLERAHPPGLLSYSRSLFSEAVVNLWHPLTVASHDALSALAGPTHSVHHFANTALHLLAGALFFLWLRTLPWSPQLAAILALAWILHPLTVEPTAWISGRKDLLLAVFTFLALWLNQRSQRRPWVYLVVALALVSKPTAIVLPFALVLDQWLRLDTDKRDWRLALRQLLPYLPGVTMVVLLTFHFQEQGTQNFLDTRPLLLKWTQAGWALQAHLRHAIWPSGLHVGYATPDEPALVCAILLPLLLISLGALLFWKQAPPTLVLGSTLFLLFLLPTLGLKHVGNDLVTDRYSYLPLAGLLVALGTGLTKIPTRLLPSFSALPLALLAVLSLQQRPHWRSTEAIFTRTLAVQPDNSYALAQMGNLALSNGEHHKGTELLNRALVIEPLQPLAHYALGGLAEARNDYPVAMNHYQQLEKTWGGQSWVKVHLAMLSWNLQEPEQARRYLQEGQALSRDAEDLEQIKALREKMGFND